MSGKHRNDEVLPLWQDDESDSLPGGMGEWTWRDVILFIILVGAFGFLVAWGAILITAWLWWSA